MQHPDYESGPGAYPNDIAVLGLASAANGDNISPIAMGSARVDSDPAGIITGWGRTCMEYLIIIIHDYFVFNIIVNGCHA